MTTGTWEIEYLLILRLFVSLILGGMIGLEREMHGRPAGLRTHLMVCLGATSLIIASEFTQMKVQDGSSVFNPDRVAAGIITGIGFLGAGAIMREANLVRGLTTAGSIWFVAGLGIIIGKGFYGLAVTSSLIALVVLTLFRYIEHWVPVVHFRDLNLLVSGDRYEAIKNECLKIFEKNRVSLEEVSIKFESVAQEGSEEKEIEVKFNIKARRGEEAEKMVLEISRIPGVKKAVW